MNIMNINDFVDKIYCINLKIRKNKKIFIENQARILDLDIEFFNAIRNKKNPAVGCLQSHLSIIKMAKQNNYEKILIIEDDCKFLLKPELNINKIPKDWEMLYLGGSIQTVLDKDSIQNIRNRNWVNMTCHTTHSYILHSRAYDEVITNLENYKEPVDVYYNDIFHKKGTSYMLYPQMTSQKAGWSDIENQNKEYSLKVLEDIIGINEAPNDYNEETKDFRLKLKDIDDKDLPYVSILTPTKNRRKFFKMAVHCFKNFDYPKEKLEWIIVDDSDDGTTLKGILPKDKRIKYVRKKTKRKIPISEKRNMCMKYASHDILVNMDDDDYYMSHSIKARVKVLLSYSHINMVGCGIICCYDTVVKKFYLVGNKNTLAEATMCFTRDFWKRKPFNQKLKLGEGTLFIRNRKEECLRIPYNFVLFVMNHKGNITNKIRVIRDEKYYTNHFQLPADIMKIIHEVC